MLTLTRTFNRQEHIQARDNGRGTCLGGVQSLTRTGTRPERKLKTEATNRHALRARRSCQYKRSLLRRFSTTHTRSDSDTPLPARSKKRSMGMSPSGATSRSCALLSGYSRYCRDLRKSPSVGQSSEVMLKCAREGGGAPGGRADNPEPEPPCTCVGSKAVGIRGSWVRSSRFQGG
jgi:hypothetical protein